MRRIAALACAVSLLVGLAGCGRDEVPEPSGATAWTEDTGAPVAERAPLSFVVVGAAGRPVLTVELAADGSGTVLGDLGGAVAVTAGPLRGGRRSWLAGGAPLVEARLEDSGKLKLKDDSGTSLWVVKTSGPEQTKVLQGEEAEAYSLRPRSGPSGEVKVKQGEQEVGSVKSRNSGGAKVELAGGASAFSTDLTPTAGLGLLLMDRIPAPLRSVLLVELVDRARP